MKHHLIIPFLTAEAALYVLFMTMDLIGRGFSTVPLKYAGILICLLLAFWYALHGGDKLVPFALLFTAAADSFLLVLDRFYALGIFIFLFAQATYLIRLRLKTGRAWISLRLGVPLLIALVFYWLDLLSPLNLLVALYFSQLLINTFLAWSLPGRRWRLFALGLSLFVLCDLCVGIHNTYGMFPSQLYHFSSYGMWLFYLPSQVLITLSACPSGEETGNSATES